MPRILPYEQQVAPQGLDSSRASASDVNTGAGLMALGQGMQQAGDVVYRVEEQRESSSAHAAVSDLRMKLTKQVLDSENGAQPGDMGYADRIQQSIQQQIDQAGQQFQTVRGRETFQRSAEALQATFVDRSLAYQQSLAARQAVVNFNTTQDANARTLGMDPGQLPAINAENERAIINGEGMYAHLDKVKRQELLTQLKQSNAWAAAYSTGERNPEGALNAAVPGWTQRRVNGVPIGGTPGGSSFDNAMAFVFSKEGGYNANDGHTGNPVNFGINQGANPDIDVKNLTKEKAAEIYRQRYWNAIGGDSLAPGTALFAMDTAVNMGVQASKLMLEQTGGDLQKMVEWRTQRYQQIALQPGKGGYLNNWLSRTKDAAAAASGLAGVPASVAAQQNPSMVASAANIPGFADLPFDKQIALINHWETRQNQIMAVEKAQLEKTWQDQSSQAMTTGQVGTPLTEQQFQRAYGAADGTRRYNEEYKPMLELGASVQQAYGATVQQQEATLASMKPVPNTPGFAEAQKRYEVYATAVNAVRKAREADPIGFAMQQKIQGVAPLDMSTPDKMADGVAARVAPARAIQKDFGVPQLTLMSQPEAEGMRRAFQQMPSSQQIGYLAALQSKVNDPEAFRSLVQQIAPDSPETQVAAHLVNMSQPVTTQTHWFRPDDKVNPREAAALILEGKQLLNKSPEAKQQDGKSRGFPMPQEALLRQEFSNQMGNAFAGRPDAYEAAYQSARAYYAGKAARTGDLSGRDVPNTDLVKEAVTAVTGGTFEQLGQRVIKPYGMTDTDFRTAVMANGRVALESAGFKSYGADPSAYKLQGAGDGQYWVLNGTEPLRGPDGQKVVIDVNQRPGPAPTSAPVEPKSDKGSRVSAGKIKYK